MNKGILLALLGLALGFMLGLAMRDLKLYLAKELNDLLNSEAKSSCACEFRSDPIQVSLLTLSARVKNARLVSTLDQQPKLFFKKLRAKFDLSRIREHKIFLSKLELSDGYSVGAGPQSDSYKFIAWLAAPIAPERDTPDRWKLKLQALNLQNFRFEEKLGQRVLMVSDAKLQLERDHLNNFRLRPEFGNITLRSAASEPQASDYLQLGGLKASLYLSDDAVDVENLRLALNQAFLDSKIRIGLDPAQEINGDLTYSLDTQSFGISPLLNWGLSGQGKISGPLENPVLSSRFSSRSEAPLSIAIPDATAIIFEQASGDLNLSSKDNLTRLSVGSFSATAQNGEITQQQDVAISAKDFAGKFRFSLDSLNWNGIELENLNFLVALKGSLERPAIESSGSIDSLAMAGIKLKPVAFTTLFQDGSINFTASQEAEGLMPLQVKGQIQIGNDKQGAHLNNLELKAQGLELLSRSSEQAKLWINSEGQFKGELASEKLTGSAKFSLSTSPHSSASGFAGLVSLSSGALNITVNNPSQSLTAEALINLREVNQNKFSFAAKDFAVSEFFPEVECFKLNMQSVYHFDFAKWREGKGSVNLDKLELGCDPFTIWTSEPYHYSIDSGTLSIPSLNLNGTSTDLDISGKASLLQGLDIKTKGNLSLHSVLPLLPRLDHLSGNVHLDSKISGAIAAPKLEGKAQISEGEIGLEAANISAETIQGTLQLSSEEIKFGDLSGILNGGQFTLSGLILPQNLKQSQLNLKMDQVFLEPDQGTTLLLSGQLNLLKGDQDKPIVKGKIRLERGEFQRDLDLTMVLRTLVDYVFSVKQAKEELTSLPDIEVEIKLFAPNNLFIFTNWLGAELKSNLKIVGTLSNPSVTGKLETLSGWFGFKDRRFDINSGTISFKPTLDQPELKLLSETYLVTPNADSLLVVLEASGPLTNPRIELSSDSGLAQREILNLLTSGQSSVSELAFERPDPGMRLGAIPLLRDESEYAVERFFSNLATIDSIALEPAYNPQRGVIDPSIVATKTLSDKLYLRGESFFSGSDNQSKLSLFYTLSPKFSLAGTVDTISRETNTALGLDLTYTIWAKQRRTVAIELKGNRFFERSELLKRLRISEGSTILPKQIDNFKEALTAMYRDEGYFQSQAELECVTQGSICQRLNISIKEGPRSKVQELLFEGDALPDSIRQEEFIAPSLNKIANSKLIGEIQHNLIKRLRSEGYVSARIGAAYEDALESSKNKLLKIKVHTGKPISFIFNGNKEFSDEELLSSINLFGRRQPFGNNTINLLVQNIERKYREEWFLFASIDYKRINDPASERITYRIEIEEEGRIRVSKVVLRIDGELGERQLRKIISQHDTELSAAIFDTDYAIAENLERNAKQIREVLIEAGYPQAQTNYAILPEDEKLIIQYFITPGAKVTIKSMSVEKWPADLTPLRTLQSEFSIAEANHYLASLTDTLIEHGYLGPQISQNFNGDESKISYLVDAGPLTRISRIKIVGNSDVKSALIRKRLKLKKGQAWNSAKLYRSKSKLLKLGLFSRVEIVPADGKLDQAEEALLVRVEEKPLRTLEVGGGLNSEYGLHLFGEAFEREFFKDGRSLSFRLDSYYDSAAAEISQGVASLKYVDPYLFDSDYSLTEDFRFQKLDLSSQEFDLDRVSLASQLYRLWRDGSSISLAHTILQENLTDVSPDAALSELDQGVVNLSILSAAFGYDRRDNPLNPLRGYTAFIDSQLALEPLGSNASFYALGGRFSLLQPLSALSRRFSFAQNVKLASAWTFDQTPHIPISQRYYLGGRNTIRGFRENSLGPLGAQGSVIGGDVSALANFELRYLLAEAASIHTFFDAGNVFLRDQNPEYDDIRLSAGIGVRYLSPIGPIGFDLGHPLDEKPGEPSLRLHFNIGTNF